MQPLVVQEVELAEPQGGRGAGAPGGVRGVPHRHVHGLGRRPVGLCAHGAGPRGRGHRREDRPGRVAGARGRPRGHAVQPPVRRVRALHQPAHQPLHGHPRGAGQGPPARRHHPAEPRRRGHPPLHGHLHVRRVHGDAGDRAGRGQPRRPRRPRVRVRLRPVDRAWARPSTPRAWSRARPWWSTAPAWWAWARWPARGSRAPSGSCAWTCPRSGWRWHAARAPPTRSWAATTAWTRSWR